MSEVNEISPRPVLLDPTAKLGELILELDKVRESVKLSYEENPEATFRAGTSSPVGLVLSQIIKIPRMYLELDYFTRGYREAESAEAQDRSLLQVKDTRKNVWEDFQPKSRAQLAVFSIQNGIIPVAVEENPKFTALSAVELNILKLTALGWSPPEIASLYNISPSTIGRHQNNAQKKIGAKNNPHSMRRAFELGIFKIDEAIDDPTAEKPLAISIDGQTATTEELGILHPGELEILKTLAKMGEGTFQIKNLLEAGYHQSLPLNSRRNSVGRMLPRVIAKLDASAGQTVIERLRVSRGRAFRQWFYLVRLPLIINQDGAVTEIPISKESDLPAPLPPRKAKPRRLASTEIQSQPDPPPPKPAAETPSPAVPSPESILYWRRHAEALRASKVLVGEINSDLKKTA